MVTVEISGCVDNERNKTVFLVTVLAIVLQYARYWWHTPRFRLTFYAHPCITWLCGREMRSAGTFTTEYAQGTQGDCVPVSPCAKGFRRLLERQVEALHTSTRGYVPGASRF